MKNQGQKLKVKSQNVKKAVTFAFLFLTFSIGGIHAGVGTDVLSFLKIKPTARGSSLGDGFVSIANDVNAAYFNPAGLTEMKGPEVSFMHMAYIAETSYEYGAVGMPISDKISIAVHAIYLNYGSITRTTETGAGIYLADNGSFTPGDLGLGISAGYRLSDSLSAGLTLKYASETIDAFSISGLMADAGLLASIEGINIGAAFYNIGTAGTEKTPMYGRLGLSTRFSVQKENDLTVGAGASYVLAGNKIAGSVGAEYTYEDLIVVRGSYGAGTDLETLNIGAGIKGEIEGITGSLDYNFSLLGDAGGAHRISLGVKFGQDGSFKGKSKQRSYNNTIKNTNKPQKKGNTLKYYFKR